MMKTITRKTEFGALPEYLTIEELSAFTGIGKSTAYRLVTEKKLRARRIGGRWFIPKTEIEIGLECVPA